MNKVTTIIVILAILVAGYFIFKDKLPMSDTPAPVTTTETSSNEGTDVGMEDGTDLSAGADVNVTLGAVKEFTVTGSSFAFAPKTMTVNKGDTVRITFKNSGGMHDLKIDEFGVATQKIAGGQQETVQFVADKAGSFEYYCSVGTHRQMGMVGTLIVK